MDAKRLAEIRARCDAMTGGRWSACLDGKCSCKIVAAADYPIARVISGKWGDDYPALRMVPGTGSVEGKFEVYVDQITYGEIPEDVAEANINFIAHARQDIPDLLDEITRIQGSASP